MLESLVTKYRKSLKELSVAIIEVPLDELKTCFAHISRFVCLESLKIQYEFPTTTKAMDQCLQRLAKKCIKLKKFEFNSYNTQTSKRLFFAFSQFRSLERLVLNLKCNRQKLKGSVECLKKCIQLKHLSINYCYSTQNFFANIQTILPNLRYLNIESYRFVGKPLKPFVESLQTMKSIERVVVNNSMKFYYQKNRLESKPRMLSRVVIDSEEVFVRKIQHNIN